MSSLSDAIEQLDVRDWIEPYTEVKSGPGDEIQICCPACLEDDYKCYINTDKKCWLCHKCEFGRGIGDVAVLLAEVSGMSLFEVRKDLLNVVIPAPTGDLTEALQAVFNPPETAKPSTTEITAVPLPGSLEWNSLTGRRVRAYAWSRGLTDEYIDHCQLRVAPRLCSHLGPWLVFPIFVDGIPVGWQGRSICPNPNPKFVSCPDIAKWLWPIFHQDLTEVVLVEGVLDALGLQSLQIPALCTFGKKISDDQIALLKRLGVKKLIIGWDADAYRESYPTP
jgi:hypothetical protein